MRPSVIPVRVQGEVPRMLPSARGTPHRPEAAKSIKRCKAAVTGLFYFLRGALTRLNDAVRAFLFLRLDPVRVILGGECRN